MTNEITGREAVVALKKGSVWGTPVACGAGDGLQVLSDNIKNTVTSELDDSAGQQWISQADEGPQDNKGGLDAYMRWEGFDVAIALLMGATAGVPTQQGATAAYANTYSLTSKIIGNFASLAEQKLTNKIWEFPSIKLHGFKLSGEMNKPVKIVLDSIANKLDRASSVNTTTTILNVTYPDVLRIFMNSQTVFRINDQDGDALASGDMVSPTSFEFAFNRPMDSVHVAGVDGIDEPTDNGFPTCKLSLKFPKYNTANDAFFDDWDAFTSKKMDITFTGPLIEDTYYYTFKISMPHVKINNPQAPLNGPGKIPFSLDFDVLAAAAAPTGMTHTTPFQIDVINKRTTDPLA